MAPTAGGWSSIEKAARKLDTVDIEEHVKADVVRDAEECGFCDCAKMRALR
jgi:hypothetical protein